MRKTKAELKARLKYVTNGKKDGCKCVTKQGFAMLTPHGKVVKNHGGTFCPKCKGRVNPINGTGKV